MRNTNPFVIRNTSEIICFSLFKNVTCFQTVVMLNMLNAKYYDSEPVVYQSENTARDMQQWDREKTRFKQIQATKTLLTLTKVKEFKRCMDILHPQTQGYTFRYERYLNYSLQLQTSACNFIKKETLAQVFSCEFCEISKNTFSYKTLLVTATDQKEIIG